MQKTFTKQYMHDNCGCYETNKLEACSFMNKGDQVLLSDIVNSEIPLKDKFWFVCRKLKTKQENQNIAIDIAEIVLPIFEQKYPEDKRPREAIEAAKLFIAGHISIEQLYTKRRAAAVAYAAYAADAVAYAAVAYAYAYAAADAAHAAAAAYAAAAYAAADAAYAAEAAAAYAAYAAYAADAYKEKLFQYLVKITS